MSATILFTLDDDTENLEGYVVKAEMNIDNANELETAWAKKAMLLTKQYFEEMIEPMSMKTALIDTNTSIKITSLNEYDNEDEDEFEENFSDDEQKISFSIITHGSENLIGGFTTPTFRTAYTIFDSLKTIASA